MSLKNRIALVTGAANGLGAEISKKLAEQGAKVILTDVAEKNLKDLTDDLLKDGKDVESMLLDVGSEKNIVEVFQNVREKYGKLDILVNNAGISPKVDGIRRPTREISAQEWTKVLTINLTSVFLCTRESIDLMKENKWGRIVNISSQAGRTSSRAAASHYSATKSGVIGFTRTFATEHAADGITANCVAPGRFETNLGKLPTEEMTRQVLGTIPVGRFGRPDEVGAAVAYLCSEDAGFINGATIDINGGMYMN